MGMPERKGLGHLGDGGVVDPDHHYLGCRRWKEFSQETELLVDDLEIGQIEKADQELQCNK
jgi:hypothetical protein